jgi:hypothetical protein
MEGYDKNDYRKISSGGVLIMNKITDEEILSFVKENIELSRKSDNSIFLSGLNCDLIGYHVGDHVGVSRGVSRRGITKGITLGITKGITLGDHIGNHVGYHEGDHDRGITWVSQRGITGVILRFQNE